MIFFDTNIFIYAVSGAEADRARREKAGQLIAETDFGLSVQVMQEFMDVALRKKQLGLTAEEIREMVALMATFPVADTTVAVARRAFELQREFQIRYWDAAILAAAQELRCDTLYSEDFSDGREYGGVRVVNPFV